jgi:hypothetical protein
MNADESAIVYDTKPTPEQARDISMMEHTSAANSPDLVDDFLRVCRKRMILWASVLLYGKSTDMLVAKYQSRRWDIDCSFQRGAIDVSSTDQLMHLLSSHIHRLEERVYLHPILFELLNLSTSIFTACSYGNMKPSSLRILATTLYLVSLSDCSSSISRIRSILELYDSDHDSCLTINELYSGLLVSMSLSLRLASRELPVLEIYEHSKSMAYRTTKCIAESVFGSFDISLIEINDHTQFILSLDEITTFCSRSPYFVEFLLNPASLEPDILIPREYTLGSRDVITQTLERIYIRERSNLAIVRGNKFAQWMELNEQSPTISSRLRSLSVGLLRQRITREDQSSVITDQYIDSEWDAFALYLRCAIPGVRSIQTPPLSKSAQVVSGTHLSRYLSISGVYELESVAAMATPFEVENIESRVVSVFPDMSKSPVLARLPPPVPLGGPKSSKRDPRTARSKSSHGSKKYARISEPPTRRFSDFCPVCDAQH